MEIIHKSQNKLENIINNLQIRCDNEKIDDTWQLLKINIVQEKIYNEYKNKSIYFSERLSKNIFKYFYEAFPFKINF